MNIENRSDGNYIVTGATTDKNESIIIKLDSELDNQLICCSSTAGTDAQINNVNTSWKLIHDKEKGLCIHLEAKDRLKTYQEIYDIDDETCINELTSMVKNAGTLEDCKEIQKAMHVTYNQLFQSVLEDNRILNANIIVSGIVEIKDQNRVLGHGTRFIINNNRIIVCEYAGKAVPINTLPKIDIYINGISISYEALEYNYNEHREIGYLYYTINTDVNVEHKEKELEYEPLNVPYHFSDSENMIEYIKQHNSPADIVKYKIALKGKVEILNIDRYMVNEFLI